jgi:P2 family phage contractile tail tube protein
MSLPSKLKNFIVFNDGTGYLGEVPEADLPTLTRKMEEYRGGGMNGPIKLDHGMEAMEFSWTLAGFERSLLNQWGTLTHNGVLLRFAGAIQSDDDPIAHALEVVMRGRHAEMSFGTAKAGDNTQIKIKSNLSYYKLSIDGEVLIEIDFVNMIENVGGEDRLASTRLALALA